MPARDLLGRSIDPYLHEDPPAEIPLKVPRFGDVQNVLRDYQAHSLYMLGRFRQLASNGAAQQTPTPPPVGSIYEIAIPLLRACMVEDVTDDEAFELMGALDIQLEQDLNHPLLARCLELAGVRPPENVEVSQEQIDKILGMEQEGRLDPLAHTSG